MARCAIFIFLTCFQNLICVESCILKVQLVKIGVCSVNQM